MVAVNEPDRNNFVYISLPCKTVFEVSKHVICITLGLPVAL